LLVHAAFFASYGNVCEAQETNETPQFADCREPSECVPRLADYPAFTHTYSNPYRIIDSRKSDPSSHMMDRWKRSLQASHWGYPEYFKRNSFGSANRAAFTNNIRDGAIERGTLYAIDFYPFDSPKAPMLTPKGLERLERAICVAQAYATNLRIEKTNNPELDEARRAWLADHPMVLQSGIQADMILLHSNPMSIQAAEAIRRLQQNTREGLSTTPGGNQAAPSGRFLSGNSNQSLE
jgi:hypothetical protein